MRYTCLLIERIALEDHTYAGKNTRAHAPDGGPQDRMKSEITRQVTN